MPSTSPTIYVAEGNRLREGRQLAPAIEAFLSALAIEPRHLEALINLALACEELGRTREAEIFYRQALVVAPNHLESHRHFAFFLQGAYRYDEAVAIYQQALLVAPQWAEGYVNLGYLYQIKGENKRALATYTEALRHGCVHPAIYLNLGAFLGDCGRHEEAFDAFSKALQLDPNCHGARYNIARLRLRQGHWDREAWAGYEERDCRAPLTPPRQTWSGAPFPGKTILLRREQGFGDNMSYVRYAAAVKERGGTVLIEASPPLRRLMERCRGIDGVVSAPTERLADLEIPIPSLPGVFDTTIETIPSPSSVPWFDVEPWSRAEAERRLGPAPGKKIGIVWESGPTDAKRSCPPEAMWEWARLPGLSLYSLQVGSTAKISATDPRCLGITDLGAGFTDFYDTAQAMLEMDLIITVDTATAHLAGALGRPTWVLLIPQPHWIYLLDRADSPWYPSMTLFRQRSAEDWGPPLREISARLAHFGA